MAGDEEEDGIDDLENEFNFEGRMGGNMQQNLAAERMLHGPVNSGLGYDPDLPQAVHPFPDVPLLTNGQMVIELNFIMFLFPRVESLPCVMYFDGFV